MWETIKRLIRFLLIPVMVIGGAGFTQQSAAAQSQLVRLAQASGSPPPLNFSIHAPWPAGVTWHAGDNGSFFDDCDPDNDLYHCDKDRYALDFNGSGANGETVDSGVMVMSVADGLVNSAGWVDGYGYSVVINHGSGYQSRYAHFTAQPLVQAGNWVPQGTPLGYVGSTGGTSTGNHLHFVMYYCDPADIQLAANSNRMLCGNNNSEIQALRPLPLEGDNDLTDGEQVTSGNHGVGFEAINQSDLTNANAIRIHQPFAETYRTLGGEFIFGLTTSAVQRWQGAGNFYQEFGPSSHQNVPWEGLRSALIEKDNIAYVVLDPIWDEYKQQGGPNSRLGLPISHTYDQYVAAPNGGQVYQLRTDFEHGSIIGWPPGVTELYDAQNATWRGRIYEDSNFQNLNLERYDKYIDFQWVPEQNNDPLRLKIASGWISNLGRQGRGNNLSIPVEYQAPGTCASLC